MGLKTGGQSAVPTKGNEDISQLAILREKMRRSREEFEEYVRSEKHEANQKEMKSKLSTRHSKSEKVETEKKPMMAHDDEKKKNEIDNHDNDEDEFTKNHQKISDTIERSQTENAHQQLLAAMKEYIKTSHDLRTDLIQLMNIHATKKLQKIPKSPKKNHTRNLSRRRIQNRHPKKFGSTITQKIQKPAQKGLKEDKTVPRIRTTIST